jgi:hypothetical protein
VERGVILPRSSFILAFRLARSAATTTAATTAVGPVAELAPLLVLLAVTRTPALSLLATAASTTATASLPPLLLLVAGHEGAGVRVGAALAVGQRRRDLELVQLVPFGVGSLYLGYRPQLLQAGALGIRVFWVCFAHVHIISCRAGGGSTVSRQAEGSN